MYATTAWLISPLYPILISPANEAAAFKFQCGKVIEGNLGLACTAQEVYFFLAEALMGPTVSNGKLK